MDRIIDYVAIFVALMIVLPVHEFAHAYVAYKSGDPTAKLEGRLTLNPFAHFEPMGLLALLFVHFGWGKPVPINPYNFKHRKLDTVLVSLAGVISNYLLAFLVYPLFILFANYVYPLIAGVGTLGRVVWLSLYYIVELSLYFTVFNFLPFYPLDGFKLFEALDEKKGPVYRFMRKYSEYILIFFILLGIVADFVNLPQIDILGIGLNYVRNLITVPIEAFWGLIF